ncbi:hypothetical protein SBOR_2912 [Sclerotinia borealis F-4128]|uniref:Uncharacterized protein n=1 Tax=Sclerotinia borealis (strain F-4128) TaxID=1432307 RepID=W9CIW3_SCLBF|nr:hypothetical protein SBOR_2912 [Sclerotinia borealis F-4128]
MAEPSTNKRSIIIIFLAITLFVIPFSIPFIALDMIHIPYVSHGLASLFSWMDVIFSPIYPFWAPVFLGISIKLYRHEPFPKQKNWITTSILIFMQRFGDVILDTMTLLGVFDGFCSFGHCRREYIQAASFAFVIVGEIVGFPWDAKIIQMGVEKLVVECGKEAAKEAAASTEDEMEKGVVGKPAEEVVYLDVVKSGLHEEQILIDVVQIEGNKPLEMPEGDMVK